MAVVSGNRSGEMIYYNIMSVCRPEPEHQVNGTLPTVRAQANARSMPPATRPQDTSI